jgi:hypothetical protein
MKQEIDDAGAILAIEQARVELFQPRPDAWQRGDGSE